MTRIQYIPVTVTVTLSGMLKNFNAEIFLDTISAKAYCALLF